MKRLIALCLFFAASSTAFSYEQPERFSQALRKDQSATYLRNRIPLKDKRYPTFYTFLSLIEKSRGSTIVETGTAREGCTNCRGDGCSSVIFSDIAKDRCMEFYSVDNDPEAIASASKAVSSLNPNAHFIVQDSIAFLRDFNAPIDFLYLDSYDFDENDPMPSQLHHLNEIQAAYPHLHRNSVIMIDDCALPHGGKGKLAIEWLRSRGWKELLSHYQVILILDETE